MKTYDLHDADMWMEKAADFSDAHANHMPYNVRGVIGLVIGCLHALLAIAAYLRVIEEHLRKDG